MTHPGQPPTADLRDRDAEVMVLKGVMVRGPDLVAAVTAFDFDRADFYWDAHQRLYDVLCYLTVPGTRPGAYDAYRELKLRGDLTLGGNFARGRETMTFLIDVRFHRAYEDRWFADHLGKGPAPDDCTLDAAVAAAAAVQHLAARRRAYYTAMEVVRDALDPTGGAAEIEARVGRMGGAG